jgi:uncharacterized protein DUF4383
MEPASPARLYAAAVGALLVVLGLVGFFYNASFGALDHYEDALGALQVNAWINLFYLAIGGIGLLVAGASSRTYALAAGVLFTALAIVGWGSWGLHLVLGLLGLAAALGTPRNQSRGSFVRQSTTKEPRNSEAGAKAARQRA